MVDRQVVARHEVQAEQAAGAVEGRLHHRVEPEIGLELGVVDGVLRLPHLLGPVAPVPGLDRARGSFGRHLRLERLTLALHGRQGARPDLVEQPLHRSAAAGHGVGQREVGVAGVAVQPRLLVPQAQDGPRHLAVVAVARVLAAARPGAPRGFAQVAPLGEGEEGHDQRPRQRDHVALEPALGRRLACRGAHEVGQPGQVGLGRQRETPARFVVQHVLPEARGQLRQFGHHRGIARAVRALQPGAGAHEVEVDALEHALLLGRQAQFIAPRMQGIDARKQLPVQVGGAVVRGQRCGHAALHGLQLGVGVRRGEVVEDGLDAAQQPAAAVEGGHGVVEIGCRRVVGDQPQFVAVRLHGGGEGRLEVVGADVGKRRQAVGRLPGLQQRIGLGHGRGAG